MKKSKINEKIFNNKTEAGHGGTASVKSFLALELVRSLLNVVLANLKNA